MAVPTPSTPSLDRRPEGTWVDLVPESVKAYFIDQFRTPANRGKAEYWYELIPTQVQSQLKKHWENQTAPDEAKIIKDIGVPLAPDDDVSGFKAFLGKYNITLGDFLRSSPKDQAYYLTRWESGSGALEEGPVPKKGDLSAIERNRDLLNSLQSLPDQGLDALPTPEEIAEKEAKRVAENAKDIAKQVEDLTYKNLLDIDEVFIPPVYQPLNAALVRQFSDRVGVELLGRSLTREEKARAVGLFRGIERNAYSNRKDLAHLSTQINEVEKAMAEAGVQGNDPAQQAAAFQAIQGQLSATDPQAAAQLEQVQQLPGLTDELTGQLLPEEIEKARQVVARKAEAGIPDTSAEGTMAQFQEELMAREQFEHPWQTLGTSLRRLILSARNQGGGVI